MKEDQGTVLEDDNEAAIVNVRERKVRKSEKIQKSCFEDLPRPMMQSGPLG